MDNNKEKSKVSAGEERLDNGRSLESSVAATSMIDGSARSGSSSCPPEIESFEAKLARKLKQSDTTAPSTGGVAAQAQVSEASPAASGAASASAQANQSFPPQKVMMDFEARLEAKLTSVPYDGSAPTNANKGTANKASSANTKKDDTKMVKGAGSFAASAAYVFSQEKGETPTVAAPASASTGQQHPSTENGTILDDVSQQQQDPFLVTAPAAQPGAFPIGGMQSNLTHNMLIAAADTNDTNNGRTMTSVSFEDDEESNPANSCPLSATLYESVELSLQRKRTTDLERGAVSPFSSLPEEVVTEVKVFEGESRDNDNEEGPNSLQSKQKRLIGMVVVISVVVIAAAAVGLVMRPSSPSSPLPSSGNLTSSTNDTAADVGIISECNGIIYPPAIDGLVEYTLRDLDNQCSAAYKANEWMWNDPNLQNYSFRRQIQRFGLAAIYFSTNGHNWTNTDQWLDYNTPECDWFFSEEPAKRCDSNGIIVSIGLRKNNLQGPLPIEIAYLFSVTHVDYSDNKLVGQPPLVLGEHSIVESFNFSHNMLEAHFEAQEAGHQAPSLRIMDLSHNRFTGDSSGGLYAYPNIEIIMANDNFFSGTFDRPGNQVMLSMEKLRIYRADNNRVTGTIPSNFGAFKALEILDVSGNFLSGFIPVELGNAPKLTYFNTQGILQ